MAQEKRFFDHTTLADVVGLEFSFDGVWKMEILAYIDKKEFKTEVLYFYNLVRPDEPCEVMELYHVQDIDYMVKLLESATHQSFGFTRRNPNHVTYWCKDFYDKFEVD